MRRKTKENVGILLLLCVFMAFCWTKLEPPLEAGEVVVSDSVAQSQQEGEIPWESSYPASLLPQETISINSATAEDLERLPSIGAVRAAAIVAYREEHGPFTEKIQLMEVYGIGETTVASIRDYITLD